MTKVVITFSMSLDGFVAGANISVAEPMGLGGEALHDWLFTQPQDAIDAEMAREAYARVGAVVLGRRTYDLGIGPWEDTPFPAPSFVLTHEARPPQAMKSASFTFVTEGIEAAVAQARAAAGGKDVVIMGAETARQCLAQGLADEIVLQIVPLTLGAGTKLFDGLLPAGIGLTPSRALASPRATHLSWTVERR